VDALHSVLGIEMMIPILATPPGQRMYIYNTVYTPNGEFMPKAIRKSKTEIRRQATPAGLKRPALTPAQKRELARLAAMPDEKIDTSDIPELPPHAWKDAVRGRFYRPLKQAVSLRLDADVIVWLKKRGKGYQTRANSILRQRMLDETKHA
jgi:uncharacterized protein (DUF4415 family)